MRIMTNTLLAAAVMGLLLLYVWERVDIVRLGYQNERLKAKKVVLQREADELRVKLSALTAPDRIAKAATERLGMVPPREGQVILVKVHGSQAPVEPSMPVRVAQRDAFSATPLP